MAISAKQVTTDEVLDRFLADQHERLSEKTFRRYQQVVQLLRHSLDGYAYSSLDEHERQRWEAEFEANEEGRSAGCSGRRRSPRISASSSGTSWSAR